MKKLLITMSLFAFLTAFTGMAQSKENQPDRPSPHCKKCLIDRKACYDRAEGIADKENQDAAKKKCRADKDACHRHYKCPKKSGAAPSPRK